MATTAARPPRRQIRIFDALVTALTVVLAVTFFFPLYWAVVGALKEPMDLYRVPPALFPKVPQWGNFVEVGTVIPFYRFVLNTARITILIR